MTDTDKAALEGAGLMTPEILARVLIAGQFVAEVAGRLETLAPGTIDDIAAQVEAKAARTLGNDPKLLTSARAHISYLSQAAHAAADRHPSA